MTTKKEIATARKSDPIFKILLLINREKERESTKKSVWKWQQLNYWMCVYTEISLHSIYYPTHSIKDKKKMWEWAIKYTSEWTIKRSNTNSFEEFSMKMLNEPKKNISFINTYTLRTNKRTNGGRKKLALESICDEYFD